MSLMGVIVALVQLVLGLIFAIGSIYLSLSLFNRLTKGIDEEAELKKGNVAVGILMGAVILSIANVIHASVGAFAESVGVSPLNPIVWIGGIVHVLIGIVLAIISIYIAINVLDKVTKNIDEIEELKRGNVAVAIIMAIVLIAVSFVAQAGVAGISKAIVVILDSS